MTNSDDTNNYRQHLRLLRRSAVLEMTSFSAATLGRRVRDGSFPKPLQISTNRVAWRETDILDWLSRR